MSIDLAKEILSWRYEAPYDFYNNDLDTDTLRELLENPYYSVIDNSGELVGFFCIGQSAQVPSGSKFGTYSEEMIDIGIGMKPGLTGKGYGSTFFSFVLNHIQDENCIPIRLTVAKFNQRAIHLYEKFGFVRIMEFRNDSTEFIVMIKKDL
ncbi:GNAT family N-acetyltransferase [Viridibacillus sp. YIM B01967]|uniref:GNAT family N-acetyltransferase n=2 Tax=Viridibacillus soli TaxID=2798301 RepID=A0ABS1H5K5_9BACL|nr:GNAT family N-acetyltransferase [Viridibacillus soli]